VHGRAHEKESEGDVILQAVRFIFASLLIVVLASAPGIAQTQVPGEMVREARVEADSLAVALPNAPTPQPVKVKIKVKIIDKKFIAVMAALGSAESMRFTTHKLVLEHEYAAGAPWVADVPRNSHLVAKYAPIYAAELLLAYELKKPHSWLPGDKVIRKFWWVYPAAMAPIHIKNGYRSIRTQAPSGCPPEACGQ
jgi:hypothetical protein